MDRGMFWEELMEEQRYVVIAAIAALMVMVETSVFISYNISGPIDVYKRQTQKEGLLVFDFEKPNIEIVEISEDKRYGKFVVEPLERGYGTTLGNSRCV